MSPARKSATTRKTVKKAATKKKTAAKKASAKKASARKAASKKASKATSKKAAAKKTAKKAAKATSKKATAKKAAKATSKRATKSTKAAKATSKKAATKKATPAASKKASTRKAAPKAGAKKASGAKATAGGTARKKASPKVRYAPATPASPEAKPGLGYKWSCYACAAKFYDLEQEQPLCPRCGANQREQPLDTVAAVAPKPAPRPKKPAAQPMARYLDDEEQPVDTGGDEGEAAELDIENLEGGGFSESYEED